MGLYDGPNTYGYVGGNPINFMDPFGLFKFCRRKIEDSRADIFDEASEAVIDFLGSPFNLGVYHESGFYEDGTPFGFPCNYSMERKEDYNYCETETYDDDIIREVEKESKDVGCSEYFGPYHTFKNNCQDGADKIRDRYKELWRKKNCRSTKRGLRCKSSK
ncbi:hypothetical protein LU351_19675 [Marinibactrum halimedae]|uniref:RHS repeat-associated core domain-containing protein n=1 Tax=Marinibactrum halimedae TaxID=1444977 RepID=A0AA37T5Z9_9GAMM|nr:hypothetical protein [Marinibactrum halimedae]GLS28058.1 hypothetical protein GCM10007877_37770 [Marinibactrum halimedae]